MPSLGRIGRGLVLRVVFSSWFPPVRNSAGSLRCSGGLQWARGGRYGGGFRFPLFQSRPCRLRPIRGRGCWDCRRFCIILGVSMLHGYLSKCSVLGSPIQRSFRIFLRFRRTLSRLECFPLRVMRELSLRCHFPNEVHGLPFSRTVIGFRSSSSSSEARVSLSTFRSTLSWGSVRRLLWGALFLCVSGIFRGRNFLRVRSSSTGRTSACRCDRCLALSCCVRLLLPRS